MVDTRRGVFLGAGAYLLWGLFPLYWPLLDPAGAVEVLSHRVLWSLLVVGALLAFTRRAAELREVLHDPRRFGRLSLAAVLIGANWFTYIYGVTHGQVVETSLGYFINPIVTVLLGVVVLKERLRPTQWVAIGAAGLAVLVLTVQNGGPPWIALVLALSFGGYGLLKKTAGVGAVAGLAVETAVLAPLAAGYLAVLGVRGDLVFGSAGAGNALLLMSAGVVTAIPLLLFGAAATRVPLTTLGLLQYVTPTMQFLLAVLVLGEPLPLLRLVGFAMVWAGLLVFTVDVVRHRQQRLPVLDPV